MRGRNPEQDAPVTLQNDTPKVARMIVFANMAAFLTVLHDAVFGFVGFYIVVPEHRGGRIGIALAAGRQAGNRYCPDLRGHNL